LLPAKLQKLNNKVILNFSFSIGKPLEVKLWRKILPGIFE
jgi:hypothetical protein